MTDVWFLTHYRNTTSYKTSHNNIRVILSASTIQTLLSGYDANKDGVINGSDAVSNYLYLPDNAQARAMIAGYTGGESIQTAQGTETIPVNSTIQIKSQLKAA